MRMERLTLQVMNTFLLIPTSTLVYKRPTVFVFHSQCNQIRMSRVSLLVVFFLAAAA